MYSPTPANLSLPTDNSPPFLYPHPLLESATCAPAIARPSFPTPNAAAPLPSLISTNASSSFCILRSAQNMRHRTTRLREPLRHSSKDELVALAQLPKLPGPTKHIRQIVHAPLRRSGVGVRRLQDSPVEWGEERSMGWKVPLPSPACLSALPATADLRSRCFFSRMRYQSTRTCVSKTLREERVPLRMQVLLH